LPNLEVSIDFENGQTRDIVRSLQRSIRFCANDRAGDRYGAGVRCWSVRPGVRSSRTRGLQEALQDALLRISVQRVLGQTKTKDADYV
jgi:hypothetical protein